MDTKDPKKIRLLIDFIGKYAEDCLKKEELKEFVALPKDILIALLKSDHFTVDEGALFDVVLAWGNAEIKRLEKKAAVTTATDTKIDIKMALKDVITHVRFPVMGMADVATKVTTSGLLSNDQILALYTYIGMRGEDVTSNDKLPKLPVPIAMFNPKLRHGGSSLIYWDPSQTFTRNLYTISNSNRTVNKSQSSGTIQIIRELKAREKGVHVVRLKCDAASTPDDSSCDCIGWANETYNWASSWLGSTGACFIQPNGSVRIDGGGAAASAGQSFSAGTVLTFTLNMNDRTCLFQVGNAPVTKVTWPQMSNRIYFALAFRYTGWQWTSI